MSSSTSPRRRLCCGLSVVVSAAFASLTSVPAFAAPPEQAVWLGAYGGLHVKLDDWDLNADDRSTSAPETLAGLGGLRLGGQPLWWLGLEVAAAAIPYTSTAGGSNLAVEADVDALFFLTRTAWQPLLDVGVGSYSNVSGDQGADTDFQWHYGVGLRGVVTRRLGLRFEVRHVLTDSAAESTAMASNLEALVGVDVIVWDDTPEPPADRDGDGILDAADRCPAVPGLAALEGCPDRDGDGLTDGDDRCPEAPGAVAARGCPDGDGDGVVDPDDRCPTAPGLAALAGCPDRDGDGLADGDDRCPDAAGPSAARGCPDRDGDGLVDPDDKCPAEAGPQALEGCPPGFDGVLPGITFDVNDATLRDDSLPVLEAVATKLAAFPEVRVEIAGHTDDRNTAPYNLRLSRKRAEAVKAWLVGHGIAGSRLRTVGRGETVPVAPNTTEDGRAQNRRIEFHVIEGGEAPVRGTP